MSISRTLPHSLEAEENLLSCCLIDGADVISRCLEARILPESFYDAKHGIVYERLVDLYNRQKPIEASSLAEELKTSRQLDSIGGYAFITQVSRKIPTTAQAGYFIDKVREQSLLREIIRAATGAVEDCYNFSGGIDEFVDRVESQMFRVTQNRVTDRTQAASQLVKPTLDVITGMLVRKGEMTGIRSGYIDLDKLTWGFQRSDLIILAARPSMGKTSLALNITENVIAPRLGLPNAVLFFSLEMSASQLMMRLICSHARVNMQWLRDGLMSKNGDDADRLIAAGDEISRAPLFIDDSSALSVSHIRAKARRIHGRTPLGLIVVDYLQLMGASDHSVPREQQVSECSRGLKALAKELDVPVIVLSQLNRSSDKEKRRPRLSDLRESGSIEQDADVVLMLARPKGEEDEDYQVAGNSADLILAKHRNGPVGDVRLTFLRDITKFESYHQ